MLNDFLPVKNICNIKDCYFFTPKKKDFFILAFTVILLLFFLQ